MNIKRNKKMKNTKELLSFKNKLKKDIKFYNNYISLEIILTNCILLIISGFLLYNLELYYNYAKYILPFIIFTRPFLFIYLVKKIFEKISLIIKNKENRIDFILKWFVLWLTRIILIIIFSLLFLISGFNGFNYICTILNVTLLKIIFPDISIVFKYDSQNIANLLYTYSNFCRNHVINTINRYNFFCKIKITENITNNNDSINEEIKKIYHIFYRG